jgi:hypothetical protein
MAWLCSLAMVAIVMAQMLALMHSIAHAPLAGLAARSVGSLNTAGMAGVPSASSRFELNAGRTQRLAEAGAAFVGNRYGGHAHALMHALFDGHDSGVSCELYDQLVHADVAPFVVVHLPVVAPEPPQCAVHGGWMLAEQAAGFLARGPPAA